MRAPSRKSWDSIWAILTDEIKSRKEITYFIFGNIITAVCFLRMFVNKDSETKYYAIIMFSKDDCSISSKSELKCSLNPLRIDILNLA